MSIKGRLQKINLYTVLRDSVVDQQLRDELTRLIISKLKVNERTVYGVIKDRDGNVDLDSRMVKNLAEVAGYGIPNCRRLAKRLEEMGLTKHSLNGTWHIVPSSYSGELRWQCSGDLVLATHLPDTVPALRYIQKSKGDS